MSIRAKGFTLIEMAVVLVVIGLLLAVSLPFFTEKISQEKLIEGRGNISALKREIIGYALTYKSLPTLAQVVGFANSIDSWDNYIAYYPAPNLVGPGTPQVDDQICGETTTILQVDDQSDSNLAYENVAFVIASRGPNFNLQIGDTDQTSDPRIITVPDFQAPADTDHDDPNRIAGYGPVEVPVTSSTDWDIADDRSEPFDDIVEYVTLDFLRSRLDCEQAGPEGADVSFANDMDDFAQGSVGGTSPGGQPTIVIDADNNSVGLRSDSGSGTNDLGCLFYSGTSIEGNCGSVNGNDGVCDFGSGVRVFFSAKVQRSTDGGYTFALVGVDDINGINNPADITRLCGGQCGYLGYAAVDVGGSSDGLQPPKLGIKFDFFGSTGGDYFDTDEFGSPTGADHNNMSIVYWRNYSEISFTDDVNHSAGTGGALDLDSPTTENSCDAGPNDDGDYCNKGTDTWMEDGTFHDIRIDVVRNAGTGALDIEAWFDCTDANCNDLSVDYDDTLPGATFDFKISDSVTLPVSGPTDTNARFNRMRFGWTMGDCGGGEGFGVTIEDFGIAFR